MQPVLPPVVSAAGTRVPLGAEGAQHPLLLPKLARRRQQGHCPCKRSLFAASPQHQAPAGLLNQPGWAVCVICGIVALPFGGFYTAQGVIALATAALLVVLEKPLGENFLKMARKHPMKRAFLYMLFASHKACFTSLLALVP